MQKVNPEFKVGDTWKNGYNREFLIVGIELEETLPIRCRIIEPYGNELCDVDFDSRGRYYEDPSSWDLIRLVEDF